MLVRVIAKNVGDVFLRHTVWFLAADTLCHAVTLTFDPLNLTLKGRGKSYITWSKSVQNSSDIEHLRLTYR